MLAARYGLGPVGASLRSTVSGSKNLKFIYASHLQSRVDTISRPNLTNHSQCRFIFSRAAKAVSDTAKVEQTVARRFPKFMAKYAQRISGAPISHITAFLMVHELTAIVPLFGIWGAFYYFDIGYTMGMPEWVIDQGTDFIRKLAERNGWTLLVTAEKGSRLLIQGATAYAIVKAILPLRLVFSLWAMPWTAKHIVGPVGSLFRRLIRKKAPPPKDQVKMGSLPDNLQKKHVPEDTRPKL